MDGPEASGSLLAWSWVIEALASTREVDLNILSGLIRETPDLYENLSKEARGMVAFRCLEALCDPAKVLSSGGSVSSDQEENRFDSFACFGCVLQRVRDQASSPSKCGSDPFANLRKGASDKVMRELHSLIERKKANFPKCALEELRDRLQDGGVFHGTSLKRNVSCLQTQKPMQDCSVDVESDISRPGKKLRHDSDAPIPSVEQKSDPMILSDNNPLGALSGKPAQSIGLLAWRPSDVLSVDKKRHAEKSATPTDSAELDFCIKCNKGGDILICSVSSCPIVVHERCLGFSESIGNREDFLCPFCACSSAQSEYAEAKRKTVLAREKLSLFVGGNPYHHPQGCTNVNANPPTQDRNGKPFKEKGLTDMQHKGHLVRGYVHTSPSNSADCSSAEEGEDIKVEKCQHQKGKQIVAIEDFHYSGSHGGFLGVQPLRKFSCLSKNVSCASSGDLNQTQETKIYSANPSNNYVCLQSSPALSNQTKGASSASFDEFFGTLGKEIHVSSTSRYFPRGKGRIRVPWTEEEVEMLKEGMKRFGSGDMKIKPWKSILEYGSSVFSKCRTTVDLKDKWRNLIKAHSEQK